MLRLSGSRKTACDGFSRRDLLHIGGLGMFGLGLGDAFRLQALATEAPAAKNFGKAKACILLWMQGGPSQFETFSPKPGHANGGETKSIKTSVSGIEISENLPQTAKMMQEIALIRSMNSREGAHPRATYLMHTGYLPTASVKYPTIGSNVAHEIGDPTSDLPSFVRIGQSRFGDGAGDLATAR